MNRLDLIKSYKIQLDTVNKNISELHKLQTPQMLKIYRAVASAKRAQTVFRKLRQKTENTIRRLENAEKKYPTYEDNKTS